jgi:hypothetical protein
MQNKPNSDINRPRGGVLQDLLLRIKLIVRLIGDPRVSLPIKFIPLGTLVYLFLFPDLAPGPVDDGAVIWLGTYLFVELCPPAVVQEHMQALRSSVPQGSTPHEEEVIEGVFREEK